MDDEISEKIALAQQAAEGRVKAEELFRVIFTIS